MNITLLALLAGFSLGVIVGVHQTWWRMNQEWKRNPESFKLLIDEVIAKRKAEQEEREEPEA